MQVQWSKSMLRMNIRVPRPFLRQLYNNHMSSHNSLRIYDSTAGKLTILANVKELIRKRELLLILVSKDVITRYRRSFLGLLWSLMNPILSSLVLWAVFVSVFKPSLTSGTQFAPYLLAGVLVITFFNQSLFQGAESISNGLELFLKIRVNPLLFLVANVLSNLINFLIGFVALAIVSVLSGAAISARFPAVLIAAFLLTMFSAGLAMICAILFIRFDDIKYIVTILLQLLTYLTPIFYPKEMLSEKLQFLVSINPLTSFLDVIRHSFNGTEVATSFDWAFIFASSLCSLFIGMSFFRKYWAKTVVMM